MNITLTADIENALTEEASNKGTTPELLALDCLRERFVASAEMASATEKQGTLADFLAGHIGVLASGEHVPGGARMSEETGKKLTAGLLLKRAQGRL